MLFLGATPHQSLIVGLGGVLIDIDHLIYFIFIAKIRKIGDMWDFHKRENAIHRPHFFIFHMIEFIGLFLIISYFIDFTLFLIALGFLLHLLTDAVMYLLHHKSFNWLKKFSLFYIISRKIYKFSF
jgi:hypothetical protein